MLKRFHQHRTKTENITKKKYLKTNTKYLYIRCTISVTVRIQLRSYNFIDNDSKWRSTWSTKVKYIYIRIFAIAISRHISYLLM